MLFQSSTLLALLSATASLAAPMEKREDRAITVKIPGDTRLVLQDPTSVVSGAGSHKFTFPPDPDGTSTDFLQQQFYYDLYEEGSHFAKSLYHLTCYVKVYKEFGGSEEWELSRTGASRVKGDKNLHLVQVVCPPNDSSCSDGADCSKTPGWGEL